MSIHGRHYHWYQGCKPYKTFESKIFIQFPTRFLELQCPRFLVRGMVQNYYIISVKQLTNLLQNIEFNDSSRQKNRAI